MSVLSGILGFCSDDEDVDELDGTIVVTGCSEEVAGAIDDVVLVPQALKEPTVTNARNNTLFIFMVSYLLISLSKHLRS